MTPETREIAAKAIVAFAIRNGPIEDIHASGRLTQAEIKAIMKHAVDHVYAVLDHLNDELMADWMVWYSTVYARDWDAPTAIPLSRMTPAPTP